MFSVCEELKQTPLLTHQPTACYRVAIVYSSGPMYQTIHFVRDLKKNIRNIICGQIFNISQK